MKKATIELVVQIADIVQKDTKSCDKVFNGHMFSIERDNLIVDVIVQQRHTFENELLVLSSENLKRMKGGSRKVSSGSATLK